MTMKKNPDNIDQIIAGFMDLGYVLAEDIATILYLGQQLDKPILLEGFPGVGKTTVAIKLSQFLNTNLIRLQCYEGLDLNSSVYEWNYQKQLLNIKISENKKEGENISKEIFGMDYLLQRPLLQSITNSSGRAVLLIDEIDRADEEFEAFLLEMLSDHQISIPEIGTIKATNKPYVILTSNRTRELGDALKRRCMYHWLDYPDKEKEIEIIRKNIPQIEEKLASQVVSMVHQLRQVKLQKVPGVAESIDWAQSLLALNCKELEIETAANTLGLVLKSQQDILDIKDTKLKEMINNL